MRDARPNVLLILTDDQGNGDLGCAGATDLRTPHLDALAASGARCTQCYSNAPVCSPARASLLTGRYPGNAGVRSILQGHRTATGLPAGVPTIASVLRGTGYRTFLSGKWHLGLAAGSRPGDHGFDDFFGFLAGCVDYYSHIFYWQANTGGPGNCPTHDLWEDDREIWRNGDYMTDLITDRAVRNIHTAAAEERPFFQYVAYNAPHYPMHAPAKYVDRFRHLPMPRRIMAAMLAAVDDGVGAIVEALRATGQLENTLIFFTSDNGPSREARNWLDGRDDPYPAGATGGWKGHKFSLFEGGIRVPGIYAWPNRIRAGQTIDTPIAGMDFLPTALAAAGLDARDLELDGAGLGPLLCAEGQPPSRTLFWEQDGQTAVRRGNWKLVLNGRTVEDAPPETPVHLARLDSAEAEHVNLAPAQPALTSELIALATRWREGIERRWHEEWLPRASGVTALGGHPPADEVPVALSNPSKP